LTTDAGLVLIREFDERLRLSGAVARAMSDTRTAKRTRHSMLACVRQRLFQIVGGYEDTRRGTIAVRGRVTTVRERLATSGRSR
jgi:hypothetical protein